MAKKPTRRKKREGAAAAPSSENLYGRLGCEIYQRIAERTGKAEVPWADILIELRRLTAARNLVQLLTALRPRRRDAVHSIIGDCYSESTAELAYVFGVSEGTVVNDWIPAGLPMESL